MSFTWVCSFHRALGISTVGRHSDPDKAREEAKGTLDDALRLGAWPEDYRQSVIEAEDFDEVIAELPRMFPPGATVVGICCDCGGWIDPLGGEHEEAEEQISRGRQARLQSALTRRRGPRR